MVECKLFLGKDAYPCGHETEGKCVNCPIAWLVLEDTHPLSSGKLIGNRIRREGNALVITDTYLEKGTEVVDYTQSVRNGVYEIVSAKRA